MLAIVLLYLLGKATDPGYVYWIIYWVLAVWKVAEILCKIYDAGKEAKN